MFSLSKLLSDNGKKFTARIFTGVCRILGISNVYTATNQSYSSGQAEKFGRTCPAALRHFAADRPCTWDNFTDALTHAYNTQPHSGTAFALFERVLAHPPSTLAIEARSIIVHKPFP